MGLLDWLRRRRENAEMRRERYRSVAGCEVLEQHRAGKVTDEDYNSFCSAMSNPGTVDTLIAESEKSGTEDSNFVGSFSWDNIVQWFKDNWFEILKLCLTLLLFLEPRPADADAR